MAGLNRDMTGAEVRQSFLEFFKAKDHLIVPSTSLVPAADPTLMFTNAGMVQFKEVFLGNVEPPGRRVVDTQRCLRISGKHNDLEEVGRDTYHHTLFEMLGNWSFGDYYKPEAIEWAWELLTKEWALPKERLYATVYRTDDEAAGLWLERTDLAPERLLRFDEKDNFWEMGETGPCGPCSEIHIDRGEDACDTRHVAGHRCAVNAGCARFIELWNLVFIQYSRDEAGKLRELPAKHVDTGMGLERVAAVLENVDNNYDGTLLRELISTTEQLAGKRYGVDTETDVSMRVLADHSRAVTFMITDGIEPGNDGRGYVLRRLLRRAARHGKGLGLDGEFLWKVCDRVVDVMHVAFPELEGACERVRDTVRAEEERFAQTLDRGLVHLDQAVAALGKTTMLPGEVAFRLYDTYGFPLDMTEDILRSKAVSVDRQGFEEAMEAQRGRARQARSDRKGADYTHVIASARESGGSRFAGQFATEVDSTLSVLARDGEVVERAGVGDTIDVVAMETPFYGESGGQVGDSGRITTAHGAVIRVMDTQKPARDVIVHRGLVEEGEVVSGDIAKLRIDSDRRESIRRNHSATHLLHAALRKHCGGKVHQAGSLVDERRLRFDFTHEGHVEEGRLAAIVREVNDVIRANLEVTSREMAYDDALAAGALAFFGEKYGDVVRVLAMGDYSIELCGGTHVSRTGDIGLFRVSSETGIAAGVRRIEAVSGAGALDQVEARDAILRRLSELLRANSENAVAKVEKLLVRQHELEQQLRQANSNQSKDLIAELVAAARAVGDARVVVARVDGVEAKQLRTVSDQIRDRIGSGVVVLAGQASSGVALTVAVTADQTSRFHAGTLVKELAPLVDGRGGGKPDFAQAGGKNPSAIDALLEKANELVV